MTTNEKRAIKKALSKTVVARGEQLDGIYQRNIHGEIQGCGCPVCAFFGYRAKRIYGDWSYPWGYECRDCPIALYGGRRCLTNKRSVLYELVRKTRHFEDDETDDSLIPYLMAAILWLMELEEYYE